MRQLEKVYDAGISGKHEDGASVVRFLLTTSLAAAVYTTSSWKGVTLGIRTAGDRAEVSTWVSDHRVAFKNLGVHKYFGRQSGEREEPH